MDDASRLELLHRQHAPAVRAFARRRTDDGDVDEVVADVFVVAWRKLDELPAEPRTWLLGTARRVLANRHRSARRERALYERLAHEAEAGISSAPPPGGATPDGTVLRALAGLKPADREVLLLVTWDDLSHAQAAEVLGTNVKALTMRIHRARRRLDAALTAGDQRAHPVPVPPGSSHASTTRTSDPEHQGASR